MNHSNSGDQAWLQQMRAGKQHFQQGRFPAAVKAFSAATRLLPERMEAWINLGSALMQGQHYQSATSALERAIALNARMPVAHMLLGDAQRMQGQTDQALASYRKSVKLERGPMALNRLACALRSRLQTAEAEALYTEALGKAPDFALARVNLATLQIEKREFDAAERQLTALAATNLAPLEEDEVKSARLALSEHHRLKSAIDSLASGDVSELETRLRDLPPPLQTVDEAALSKARQYVAWARKAPEILATPLQPLPDEWPLIEALFMIPLVDNVEEYLASKTQIAAGGTLSGDLHESLNMEPVVRSARRCRANMCEAVSAEAQLRHWHSIAGQDLKEFHPGHFKYTQNWAARSPTLKRADPAMTSATFQHFIRELYPQLPPGILRAAICYIVVCDLHCFADGNGRVAATWLNRELEWSGCMPTLLPADLSLKGALGAAIVKARSNGGDLSDLTSVILRGQTYARDFCVELDKAAAR